MDNAGIPGNYQTIMSYLALENITGLIQLMWDVFPAKETNRGMRNEIRIGGSTIMFADTTGEYKAHRQVCASHRLHKHTLIKSLPAQ